MATGVSQMTTYVAKQVIGSNSAQNPAGALLQSGANRANDSTTGDTWIYLDTIGGTASPWGIKHSQNDNKVVVLGAGTIGAWTQMNTGNTYLLGKLGIGYNPETSGNTYKLYVNGTSFFGDGITVRTGGIWIQANSEAGSNNTRMGLTSGMPDKMPYNSSKRGVFIYSNAIAFADPYNGNSNTDAGWIRHQETGSNAGELEIGVGDDGNETVVVRQYNTSSSIVRTLTLLNSSGYALFPSYISIGGHEKNVSSPPYVWGSNSSDNYLRSYQTSYLNVASATYASSYLASRGTVSGSNHAEALKAYFNSYKSSEPRNALVAHYSSASGNGSLCMGYFLSGCDTSPYGGFFVCHYDNPRYVGISNGTFTQHDLVTCDHAQNFTGNKSWGSSGAGGVLNGAATNGGINSIRVGDDVWLGDCNAGGIMGMKANASSTTTCGFYFYNGSGSQIGQLYCNSTNYLYSNRCLYIPNVGASWIDGQRYQRAAVNIHTINDTGSYFPWINQINTGSAKWFSFGMLNTSFYMIGSATSRTANGYDYGLSFNIANGYLQGASRVYNAVWNDYAEYRIADTEEPGRVVIPSNDGIAHISTHRLQSGGRIISDTYGSAVGQNDEAKTPVGLAGRVLAYPYQDINQYKIGDCVCTAPNGTVDIMTRKEIKEYPDRIIGIVNEIPTYDVWTATFTGEDGHCHTQSVQILGRIWIDVK